MSTPKISFIVTCYNYQDYIESALNSILNQTIQDFEIIVIDDASSDNSAQIIKNFAQMDNRIKPIFNSKNLGLNKTLQIAINAAAGEWIAFLETDDLINQNYLQEKLHIAEKYPKVGFIYNDVKFVGENQNSAQKKFQKIIQNNQNRKFPKNMFYDFGYQNPVLTMSSVMLKKKLLENVDFNTPIDKLTDWYIYIQIAQKTQFYYINKQLTFWNQHTNSYVNKNKKIKFKFANISAYIKIYKQHIFNLKLLIFIAISTIGMCLKRLKVYIFRLK